MTCPECSRPLQHSETRISTKPFRCPGCGLPLRATPGYLRSVALSSFLLSLAIPGLAGLRGLSFLIAAVALYFPLLFLVTFVAVLVVSPTFVLAAEELSSIRKRDGPQTRI